MSAALPPGRDNIPLNHPRRIAAIACLSDRELAHESEEVRRLVDEHRRNQLFPTCEAVGHCRRPTHEAAPFHHFYWDSEREEERMEKIHGPGGKGHDDPLADYGAVICKTCGRRALVLCDADDFPQI